MAHTGGIKGTAATTRLRKVECDRECGNIARQSRAAMDRGIMGCPCGGCMLPATLEDADRLHTLGLLSDEQLAAHPEAVAFQRYQTAAARGQHGSQSRGSWNLRNLDEVAFARLVKDRRTEAVANQLAAIKPVRDEEPIPF